MSKPDSNIYTLIAKYSKGDISEEEHLELRAWLAECPDNKTIFTEYLVMFKNARRMNFVVGVDKDIAWNIIKDKMEKRNLIHFRKWVRYAAVLVVPVALAISYLIISQQPPHTPQVAEYKKFEPGQPKALLILGDGSEINLGEIGDSTILRNDGTSINKNKEILDYQKSEIESEVLNTIRIPRGGEYTLVLSDGTKVWINSDSELTFPVKFIGNTRQISLVGEAYFEVTKDVDRPFLVNSKGSTVEVLGTAFNVRAYADEKRIETTLVEGSVKMSLNNENAVLLPGQQGVVNDKSAIDVRQVDTRLYTSWKDGMFTFKSLSLEEIMKTFCRWYDIEVQFEEQSLKQLHFTGNLKRYEEIIPHLDLITLTTHIDFEIEGNTITIKKK